MIKYSRRFVKAAIYYFCSIILLPLPGYIFTLANATQSTSQMNNKYSYHIDFSNPNEVNHWQSTNDGVMGGLSEGNISYKNNSCTFTGNISLENNGGFSSVYKKIKLLAKDLNTIDIDTYGDGSTYQLRAVVYVDGYRLAYKHNFKTTADKRDRVTLSLDNFQASFRGRIIENAPRLISQDIQEIGFLLSKKSAGNFSLKLFSFQIYATDIP